MNFVMMRDRTVVSTLGHSIEFKKGEPTHVPRALWDLVQQNGAVPEDELPEELKNEVIEPGDPGERQDAILETIKQMVELNRRDDFTAGGKPQASVISEKLGWTVDAKERDEAWAAFNKKAD